MNPLSPALPLSSTITINVLLPSTPSLPLLSPCTFISFLDSSSASPPPPPPTPSALHRRAFPWISLHWRWNSQNRPRPHGWQLLCSHLSWERVRLYLGASIYCFGQSESSLQCKIYTFYMEWIMRGLPHSPINYQYNAIKLKGQNGRPTVDNQKPGNSNSTHSWKSPLK